MLKLGNLILDVPYIQAPLSGYSDYPMRRLALDFGVPLTFSGVILAKSAAHPKVLRNPAFRPQDDEHPVGAQILGNDPATMAAAAKALQDAGYDIIDLNFACPVPKVLRRKRGGWLLNEPETVMQIYSRVREAVTCPVTMKLRTGFDAGRESYYNFCTIVSEASRQNVDALIIHARTVVQKFTGDVDWSLLAKIKQRFPETTLIGSGDLFEPQAIVELLKTAKLDGVLIARGAIGNPWIYRGLNAALEGKPAPAPPTVAEQGEVIRKHFEMICRLFDPVKAVGYFRKFLVRYCRLHPMRKQAQKSLLAANGKAQLLVAIEKWYGDNHSACVNQESWNY
ncbi:MAG: tRNA-dihydrouridine synthase family protein [Sedimentisphaerales bacterium]|nr:tRNA-dihydrouridine synthase family protein [Sedimentisphaerales bacterium]